MSDLTKTFKATVKTVKTRQKSQGLSLGPDKSILNTKQKSEFSAQACNVVKSISALKDFLLEHRDEYINAKGHIGGASVKMNDYERDKIDSDAAKLMQTCSEAIRTLKTETSKNKMMSQVKEHREGVFSLIEAYLKSTCKLYSEQRAVRVKRVVDKKKLLRLEPEHKKARIEFTAHQPEKTDSEKEKSKNGTDSKQTSLPTIDPPIIFAADDEELSPDEAQMFERENEQLYEEMNSMVDEVRNIESKVVEISRLQEIFTDKVLEQERDIDRVADTVVGTTENIKEANEEIREAMKNNAGLRVWILFILIVCSFSLLFLDWYNV